MSNYVKVNVKLSDQQKKKLAAAYHAKRATTVQLAHEDLTGPDSMLLTQTLANRLAKKKAAGQGMRVPLSLALIHENSKEGGFLGSILPVLAKLAPKVLPTLAKGALAAVGTWGASKLLDKFAPAQTETGAGLALMGTRRGGCNCKPGAGMTLMGTKRRELRRPQPVQVVPDRPYELGDPIPLPYVIPDLPMNARPAGAGIRSAGGKKKASRK